MALATRCFRALLHAYPAAFREEYGDEMTWAFTERRATEAAWRVWPATVLEILWTAAREHLDVTRRDVRVAVRGLSRTPALTLVILLALAIGVGANTTVYTVVRQVLWAPLPYADADRLAVVLEGAAGLSRPRSWPTSVSRFRHSKTSALRNSGARRGPAARIPSACRRCM